MVFFCAAKQPLELFGEPDPATAPRSRVDAAAILTLVAELGPWAKVRRTDRPDIAQTGWVLREHLTRIEGDASQRFVLFPEPFAEAGQALEGRLARVVIALGAWRKIVVLRADGTPFSGWVEEPAVGPDLPIGADIPATVSLPIAPPIVAAAEGGALQLGVNALYREPLLKAQAKTGIDAAALAAMIDAEAGTIKVGPQKGQWDARAFNGSSGAAGLTQFLASTWLDHARGADHELNRHALREQLVDQDGNVVDGRRDDLLALRFDPMLSILSAAEYGLANLKGLIRKGLVEAGTPDDRKAWFMYLAHHEGLTGASGFLDKTKTYSLGNLSVQVGSVKAAELTAAAGGDANRAYRLWLEAYINKKIQPSRFRGSGRSSPIATPGAAGGPSPAAGSSLALPPEEVLAYAALGNEARAFLLGHDGPALPFPTIGGNAALTKAIQEALSVHGYLDPPADGEFGPVSLWALTQFARKAWFDPEAGASRALAAALADPASGLPAIAASGVWIDKVIRFMQAKGYFISRHPECWNIVYIVGLGLDGVANADSRHAARAPR